MILKKSYRIGFIAAGFCAVMSFSGVALAQSNDLIGLQNEIKSLREAIGDLQLKVFKGENPDSVQLVSQPNTASNEQIAHVVGKILETEESLRDLTGQLELMDNKARQIENRLDKLIVDIDFRLTALERQAATNPQIANTIVSTTQPIQQQPIQQQFVQQPVQQTVQYQQNGAIQQQNGGVIVTEVQPQVQYQQPAVQPVQQQVQQVQQGAQVQYQQPAIQPVQQQAQQVRQGALVQTQQAPAIVTSSNDSLGTLSGQQVQAFENGQLPAQQNPSIQTAVAPQPTTNQAPQVVQLPTPAAVSQTAAITVTDSPAPVVESSGIITVKPRYATPEEEYRAAYELLQRHDFDGAQTAMQQFIGHYPDHGLVSNAMYWLGETFYARKQYREAMSSFAKTYQHDENGRKAVDSLLKLGMSLAQLGELEQSCATYDILLTQHSNANQVVLRRTKQRKEAQNCPVAQ